MAELHPVIALSSSSGIAHDVEGGNNSVFPNSENKATIDSSATTTQSCSNTIQMPHHHPVAEFLYQLTKMLTDDNIQYIEWVNGRIEVYDPQAVADNVLGKYFRHSKYASFQRQLNYFGFRKLSGKGKMAPCSYTNEAATTELKSLLTIRRKTTVSNSRRRKKNSEISDEETQHGVSKRRKSSSRRSEKGQYPLGVADKTKCFDLRHSEKSHLSANISSYDPAFETGSSVVSADEDAISNSFGSTEVSVVNDSLSKSTGRSESKECDLENGNAFYISGPATAAMNDAISAIVTGSSSQDFFENNAYHAWARERSKSDDRPSNHLGRLASLMDLQFDIPRNQSLTDLAVIPQLEKSNTDPALDCQVESTVADWYTFK